MSPINNNDAQMERAFRTTFKAPHTEVSVYGERSVSIMRWGEKRGYVQRVDGGTLWRLTPNGRRAMHGSGHE